MLSLRILFVALADQHGCSDPQQPYALMSICKLVRST
jgi:hypothetical protein